MIMEKSTHSVMKVYASTTDRLGSQLLYEAVVYRAREAGITAGTVKLRPVPPALKATSSSSTEVPAIAAPGATERTVVSSCARTTLAVIRRLSARSRSL